MSSGRSLRTRQHRSDQGFIGGARGARTPTEIWGRIRLAARPPPAGSGTTRTKLSFIEDPFVEEDDARAQGNPGTVGRREAARVSRRLDDGVHASRCVSRDGGSSGWPAHTT